MKSYTCTGCKVTFWTGQKPLKKGGRIVCYDCHSGAAASPFDVARAQLFAGSGDGSKAPRASTSKASPARRPAPRMPAPVLIEDAPAPSKPRPAFLDTPAARFAMARDLTLPLPSELDPHERHRFALRG